MKPNAFWFVLPVQTGRIFAGQHDLRLCFHPDQFVVVSSPHPAVVAGSIRELEYQAYLAEEVGADVINSQGTGGDYVGAVNDNKVARKGHRHEYFVKPTGSLRRGTP